MEQDDENLVRDLLAQMIGMPCWGVRQRWGSSLVMEFREPRLQVYEPIYIRDPARYQASGDPIVDRARRRRRILPVGQWHLWFHMCGWILAQGGQKIAHSESDRSIIEKALSEELDGKVLEKISLDTNIGAPTFLFEEDVKIDTWPIKGGSVRNSVCGAWLMSPAPGLSA
jgi:hypothetical protein